MPFYFAVAAWSLWSPTSSYHRCTCDWASQCVRACACVCICACGCLSVRTCLREWLKERYLLMREMAWVSDWVIGWLNGRCVGNRCKRRCEFQNDRVTESERVNVTEKFSAGCLLCLMRQCLLVAPLALIIRSFAGVSCFFPSADVHIRGKFRSTTL